MNRMLSSESPSYLQRFGLRCAVVYWALYFFPAPFNAEPLEVAWFELWQPAIAAFGKYIVGIAQPISFESSNSADRTCDYLLIALFATLALLTGLVWARRASSAERERRLFNALHLYLRYAVAFKMLVYGILKVFPVQFETPGPQALGTSLGDMHPTDLLWAFVGASPVYQFFCGVAEVAGGALLLWSRGVLVGALLVVAVMSNVVMFNFCYDVSVKQLSFHLLLAAAFLLLPYAPRLLATLLRDEPLLAWKVSERWRRTARVAQGAVLVWCVYMLVSVIHDEYADGRLRPVSPEYGVWEVERFDASSPRTSWKRVLLDRESFVVVPEHGPVVRYAFDFRADAGTLALKSHAESADVLATLRASLSAQQLTLEGPLDGTNVEVMLRRKSDFRLLATGFHWIQEN